MKKKGYNLANWLLSAVRSVQGTSISSNTTGNITYFIELNNEGEAIGRGALALSYRAYYNESEWYLMDSSLCPVFFSISLQGSTYDEIPPPPCDTLRIFKILSERTNLIIDTNPDDIRDYQAGFPSECDFYLMLGNVSENLRIQFNGIFPSNWGSFCNHIPVVQTSWIAGTILLFTCVSIALTLFLNKVLNKTTPFSLSGIIVLISTMFSTAVSETALKSVVVCSLVISLFNLSTEASWPDWLQLDLHSKEYMIGVLIMSALGILGLILQTASVLNISKPSFRKWVLGSSIVLSIIDSGLVALEVFPAAYRFFAERFDELDQFTPRLLGGATISLLSAVRVFYSRFPSKEHHLKDHSDPICRSIPNSVALLNALIVPIVWEEFIGTLAPGDILPELGYPNSKYLVYALFMLLGYLAEILAQYNGNIAFCVTILDEASASFPFFYNGILRLRLNNCGYYNVVPYIFDYDHYIISVSSLLSFFRILYVVRKHSSSQLQIELDRLRRDSSPLTKKKIIDIWFKTTMGGGYLHTLCGSKSRDDSYQPLEDCANNEDAVGNHHLQHTNTKAKEMPCCSCTGIFSYVIAVAGLVYGLICIFSGADTIRNCAGLSLSPPLPSNYSLECYEFFPNKTRISSVNGGMITTYLFTLLMTACCYAIPKMTTPKMAMLLIMYAALLAIKAALLNQITQYWLPQLQGLSNKQYFEGSLDSVAQAKNFCWGTIAADLSLLIPMSILLIKKRKSTCFSVSAPNSKYLGALLFATDDPRRDSHVGPPLLH